MRRRSIRNPELNACPMCRKVVEYGMQCEACASWFHATEQCCGDALANAFTTTGRDAWTCLNCFPQQGVAPAADSSKKHAATIDHLDWRRAFRILTDSCAGCGLKVCAPPPPPLLLLHCMAQFFFPARGVARARV